jgi:hypothetical protein
MQDIWVCDGCGAEFDDDESSEATAHFAQNDDKPDSEVVCWGLMEKSGQAYADYMDKGIHPMSSFLISLEDSLMDSGAIVEVLKE